MRRLASGLFLTALLICTLFFALRIAPAQAGGSTGFEPWHYYVGDVVNSHSGNLFFQTKDLSIRARGFSITVTRAYNSHQSTFDGPFGFGWTHNFNVQLVENPNGSVTELCGDGSTYTFTLGGGGQYISPHGIHNKLTKLGGGEWVEAYTDGRMHFFDIDGKLLRISDKNSNNLTLTYTDGELSSVADDSGLEITFSYVGNRVSSVLDPLGREIKYDYDSGRLVNVTDPTGNSTLYIYRGGNKLESIIDRVGRLLTFFYHPDGKVKEIWMGSHEHYGKSYLSPFEALHIEYLGNIAYATDARGYTTEVHMNEFGNPAMMVDPLGNTVHMTWDVDMNMIDFFDANGQPYHFDYDSKGNLIQELDPIGNPTTFSWENIDDGTRYISLLRNATNKLGYTCHYSYDDRGNLNQTVDATGNSSSNIYDAYGQIVESRNLLGVPTHFSYNTHGFLTSLTDVTGGIVLYDHDAVGRMKNLTDANGYTTQFTYNDNNWLTRVTDPMGNQTIYHRDAEGQLIQMVNANGHEMSYNENVLAKVDTLTDPSSNHTYVRYDRAGNPIKTTDANGHQTTYTYDPLNRLIAITDSLGQDESYSYDGVGNLISFTDKNGHTTTYEYDPLNRLIRTTDAAGNSSSVEYDALGNVVAYNNTRGNVTLYEYDPLNRLIRMTDATGNMTVLSYDAMSNLVDMTNPRGYTTTYSYDPLNRLITILDATGNSTSFEYDPVGNLVNLTDRNGYVTQYEYDALNRLTRLIDATGNSTRYSYDAVSNLINLINARGFSTTYTYDPLNRLINTTDPLGYISTYSYDPVGNRISETDKNGHTTTYSYDPLNRLINITDPLGYTETYACDPLGNRISYTDKNGNTYNFTYDKLNRLTELIDPLGYFETYSYDPVGNRISLTDKNGNVYSYTYDPLNRMINFTNPIGSSWIFAYDEIGNIVERIDASGNTTEYIYDALGLCVSIAYSDGSGASFQHDAVGDIRQITHNGGANETTYFEYDKAYRIIAAIVDYGSFNKTLNYTYDSLGNLLTMLYPDGHAVSYTYDASDRLKLIMDSTAGPTTFEHDGIGRITKMNLPNGFSHTYEYDQAGRLNRLHTVDAAALTFWNYSYVYDNVGNLLTIYESFLSSLTIFKYDAVHQLTNVTYPNGNVVDYAYDCVGNRVTEWLNGIPRSYTYDAANRLLTKGSIIYSYDAVGNRIGKTEGLVTTTYEYDGENRPIRVNLPSGESITYAYSAGGDLLWKSASPEEGRVFTPSISSEGLSLGGFVDFKPQRLIPITGSLPEEDGFPDYIGVTGSIQDPSSETDAQADPAREVRSAAALSAAEGSSGFARSDGLDNDRDGLLDATDPTCGSASLTASRSLPSLDAAIERTNALGESTSTFAFGPSPGSLSPAPLALNVTSESYVYLTNHQCSVTNILDVLGFEHVYYEYDAFGSITYVWGVFPQNPLHFMGMEYEAEAGLYIDEGRFYEPESGRYLTPEVSLLIEGRNAYTFEENNPAGDCGKKRRIYMGNVESFFDVAMKEPELDPEAWIESFFDVYFAPSIDFPAESFFDVYCTRDYWGADRTVSAASHNFSFGVDRPVVDRLFYDYGPISAASHDFILAGTFMHELGHNINYNGKFEVGGEYGEFHTSCSSAVASGGARFFPGHPLVSLSEPVLPSDRAFCSHIPFLEVVEPSGSVITSGGGDVTPVVAAIPLVDVQDLAVKIDGINILGTDNAVEQLRGVSDEIQAAAGAVAEAARRLSGILSDLQDLRNQLQSARATHAQLQSRLAELAKGNVDQPISGELLPTGIEASPLGSLPVDSDDVAHLVSRLTLDPPSRKWWWRTSLDGGTSWTRWSAPRTLSYPSATAKSHVVAWCIAERNTNDSPDLEFLRVEGTDLHLDILGQTLRGEFVFERVEGGGLPRTRSPPRSPSVQEIPGWVSVPFEHFTDPDYEEHDPYVLSQNKCMNALLMLANTLKSYPDSAKAAIGGLR